ncbi:MAG TPA: N-acetyl-gamma-glutamyl-phosphate reductase, partial [Lachnospiraceae bacterium]|nr:N-acetyl-gamma-glutamyl-phosphate reductase [Lachnospiraceae bacterium]
MKTKVYIDGQVGTTGLQIYERIGNRNDLELLRIDEDKRHDTDERRKFLNSADIVFLCLPDAGAIEAVSLIENPDVRVIDASTAHRTSDEWVYGYPELSKEQRAAIAAGKRVANPGCHATGLISSVAPLVKMG